MHTFPGRASRQLAGNRTMSGATVVRVSRPWSSSTEEDARTVLENVQRSGNNPFVQENDATIAEIDSRMNDLRDR